MTWLRAAALLVCLLLAACGPPKELEGRPTAPPDVAAARLLPPGMVRLLSGTRARDAAEVRTRSGGWLAALRFSSTAEAHAEFVARAAERASRPDTSATTRVDYGAVQWLRYGFPGGTGLTWQSDRWVFIAEAPDAAQLAQLIADSRVGGTGPLPAFAASGLLGIAGLAAFLAVLAIGCLWLLRRSLVVRPPAGVLPVEPDALRARLLALEASDRPWQVRTGTAAGVPSADLVVEWKWADAQWLGLLARNGLTRTYRLRLYLDPGTHQCGALDETSEVDWSAGAVAAPRLSYSRSVFRGVRIARRERAAAWAAATSLGMPQPAVDARFDLDALKQPVIAAVTAAGWTYRPLLWPPRRRVS
ncbi:MAG: hypothetical protein LCH95_00300 [Proteobacteria bacterium]|nr:hypothetical protein [Pseudomonadota bacterium]